VLDNLKALLPPAVGQSAALIDYFFRGQISVSIGADGSVSVRNESSSESLGTGMFSFFTEGVCGGRVPVGSALTTQSLAADLAPGGEAVFAGSVGALVGFGLDLVVVFDGEIGIAAERGIAIGHVAIASSNSLSFDAYLNDTFLGRVNAPDPEAACVVVSSSGNVFISILADYSLVNSDCSGSSIGRFSLEAPKAVSVFGVNAFSFVDEFCSGATAGSFEITLLDASGSGGALVEGVFDFECFDVFAQVSRSYRNGKFSFYGVPTFTVR
jgi:hypothetical protein